jgi:hypothetical protein
MTKVTITLDEDAIRTLLTSPEGDVGRAVTEVVERTAALARANAGGGALAASIKTQYRSTRTGFKGWVYTDLDYGLYVHEGTGIYGPKGAPIRPKKGKYLVFTPKGGPARPGRNASGKVFARQVKGMRPRRYLLEALIASSPWPVDDTVIYT